MSDRRPSAFAFLSMVVFLSCAGAAWAGEIVDGNNPPTVRNNMHVCPPGYIVTGVNVGANQLLCLGRFQDSTGDLTRNETVVSGSVTYWPPDNWTRVANGYASNAPNIPWCGSDRYVTGVHVANRTFSCASFPVGSCGDYTSRLGHVIVDSGSNPTQRNNMHACPRGFVLAGANFDTNTFLCAELPFCQEASHCAGSGSGDQCERRANPVRNAGMCRREGVLTLWSDNGCGFEGGEIVGLLSDRSGTVVDLSTNPAYEDDEASSLDFWIYRPGVIVRAYDEPDGDTGDDWTEIVAKIGGSPCLASFESSFSDGRFAVQAHPPDNGLDGDVSRIEVQSAILDYDGRCLDVNQTNNSVQIFGCHAGRNQAWTWFTSGEIRGFGGLCLEANSAEINNWPFLGPNQTRRAAVRIATCNGSVFQKWSVTEAGQIRMFADMCLDIAGGTSFNQASVQIHPCHGGQNQRWRSSF